MYSVCETIENGKTCVAASPAIWNDGHILRWPPGPGVVDTSVITPPGPDWIPHMCRVLRTNIETFEEAVKAEKMYSKHRDSDSFREAEAEKKSKREHPVNTNLSSLDLIDVNIFADKIDEDADKSKATSAFVQGSHYHKQCGYGYTHSVISGAIKKTAAQDDKKLRLKKREDSDPKRPRHDGSLKSALKKTSAGDDKKLRGKKCEDRHISNSKRPRYDNFLKSGTKCFEKPSGDCTKNRLKVPSATITKAQFMNQNIISETETIGSGIRDGQEVTHVTVHTHSESSSNLTQDKSSFPKGVCDVKTKPSRTHFVDVEGLGNDCSVMQNFNDFNRECSTVEYDNGRLDFSRKPQGISIKDKIDVLENIVINPPTQAQAHSSFEAEVLGKLKELKESQKESDEKLLQFQARMETKLDIFVKNMLRPQSRGKNRGQHEEPDPVSDSEYDDFEDLDRNFPLKSDKSDLSEFEWSLRTNLDFKLRVTSRLNELTAKNEKKCMRVKMKYLISDAVLDHYTWRGTADKKAFNQLTSLNGRIFKSVRKQFPKYKLSDYKDYMVEWLKHSGTRQRTVTYTYPNRKNQKKDNFDDEDEDEDDMDFN